MASLRALELKIPPLALVVLVAALMWSLAAALPDLDLTIPSNPVFALALSVLGAAICLSGVVSFRLAKTTVNPMSPASSSSLVVSGIYRYTRNPMYLGFLLVLVGWAVFLSNLLALAWLPIFVWYLNRFQIGPEERVLASLFPNEYPKYRDAVRRWA